MLGSDQDKRVAAVEWAIPLTGFLLVIALCFGVGMLAGSAKTDLPTKEQVQVQAYTAAKARYTQAIAGTNADPVANYSAYPDQNASECYYANDHDSADLCAQWRAALAAEESAKWTRNGFWVSLGGGALSAIGLALLLLSLRQTERALLEAQKATRFAGESHYAFIRVEDAYLIISFTRGLLVTGTITPFISFDVNLTNVGRSAAIVTYVSTTGGGMVTLDGLCIPADGKPVSMPRRLHIEGLNGVADTFKGAVHYETAIGGSQLFDFTGTVLRESGASSFFAMVTRNEMPPVQR